MSDSDATNQGISEEVKDVDAAADSSENVTAIFNLTIVTPTLERVKLPAVSAADIMPYVIKQLLLGFRETCAYSAYGLEYRSGESGKENHVLLNDYMELHHVLPASASNSEHDIFMVLQDYSLHDAKVHVRQTVDVLLHPRPPRDSSEESADDSLPAKEVDPVNVNALKEPSLKKFFQETILNLTSTSFSAPTESAVPECIKGVSYSGWNPPPPSRRLHGDICYLDVETTNGHHCITCIPSGFYLNRSSAKAHFDPRPATPNAHFSHELLFTILSIAPAVKAYWENPPKSFVASREWNLDTLAMQLHKGNTAEMFLEPAVLWSTPREGLGKSRTEDAGHSFDINRAMVDFANPVVDLNLAVTTPAKEWNQEMQQIKAMFSKDPQDIYLNTKAVLAMRRLSTEFKETATAVATAILEGRLLPINPGEPKELQIFICNNIFFSHASDTKGSFKLCRGNAACRKSFSQDMMNQKFIQNANIDELNTVLTCLVDYKGCRIVAQSMIPGVLQTGENAARLMYGSVDPGKRLRAKAKTYEVMKQLGEAFGLTERSIVAHPSYPPSQDNDAGAANVDTEEQTIRIDDDDENFSLDAKNVSIVGPVECKVLLGTDNRQYILEVARLSPRDANYVNSVSGGAGNIDDAALDALDETMFITYTYRQELLYFYRMEQSKNAFIERVREAAKESELKQQQQLENSATSEDESVKAAVTAPENDATKSSDESTNKAADSTAVLINPNVFIELAGAEGEVESKSEEILADEGTARSIADFLWNKILPTLTEDIRIMNTLIIDGSALTKYLHENGINMRYLGRLAELARIQEATDIELRLGEKTRVNPMPKYWLELLETELIARSVKHIFINAVQKDENILASPATVITDILSYLLGTVTSIDAVVPDESSKLNLGNRDSNTGKKKKKGNKSASDSTESTLTLSVVPETEGKTPFTRAEFWELLQTHIAKHFNGKLSLLESSPDAKTLGQCFSSRISRPAVLRRVSQQLGIRISASDFDYSSGHPFAPSDLTEVVARAKMPVQDVIPYVDDLRDKGRDFANKGELENASATFEQATMVLEQLVGNQCKEMLALNEDYSKVLIQAGQSVPEALFSAKSLLARNLIVAIRTTGLDSHTTLQQHLNLANVLVDLQNFEAARLHLKSAAYLVSLIAGYKHPEMLSVLILLADTYSRAKDFESAIKYLNIVKEGFEESGEVVKFAFVLQNLADLNANADNFKDAKALQTDSYKLIRQIFGENDVRTLDSKQRCEAILRTNFTKESDLNQQRQNEMLAKKEKERSRWLEDDDDDESDVKKSSKKKKNAKKNSKK